MKTRFLAVLAVLMLVLPFGGVLAQDGTIVDLAAGNEDLSTLVELVQAAGLAETLASDELTVFAPTNEAFGALDGFVVEYLQNNPDALTAVLTHHVVGGTVMSGDLSEGDVASLQGSPLSVMLGDEVMVDGATVVTADVAASNGVVHVIDSVLLPDFALPAVDPLEFSENVIAAGSSTVFPVTERMADLFNDQGFGGTITVDSIGSGAGFERFCVNAETDISNASRPIRESEVETCLDNDRNVFPFRIGIDALAVTVSQGADFIDDVTIEELAAIYSAGAGTTWADINPDYPAEEIQLFSPGTDSGTFDFFVEEVFDENEEPILNANPQLSEDDNVLVQGVTGSSFATAYFGYAYFSENEDTLKALSVNGVEPTAATAESGEYPLSRPLFIYTTPEIMQEKPQVAAFVNFYLQTVNSELGTGEGEIAYFPVGSQTQNLNVLRWYAATNTPMDMGM